MKNLKEIEVGKLENNSIELFIQSEKCSIYIDLSVNDAKELIEKLINRLPIVK